MSDSEVQAARVRAALSVKVALDTSKITWAVLHGIEGLPERVGRDLDILVDGDDVARAGKVVSESLVEEGWESVVIKTPWGVVQNIFGREVPGCGRVLFQVDLLSYQMWCMCPLVSGVRSYSVVRGEAGFPVSPWAGFVKRILIQILSGSWDKLRGRPDEFVISENDKRHVSEQLEQVVGRELCSRLCKLIEDRDMEGAVSIASELRWFILMRLACGKGYVAGVSCTWIRDKWNIITSLRKRAPIVVVSGFAPDGDDQLMEVVFDVVKVKMVFAGIRIIEFGGGCVASLRHSFRARRASAFMELAVCRLNGGRVFGSGDEDVFVELTRDGQIRVRQGSFVRAGTDEAEIAGWVCEALWAGIRGLHIKAPIRD